MKKRGKDMTNMEKNGVKEGADSEEEYDKNNKEKTKSLLYQLEVTLEDVYKGARKQLEINRFRFCEICRGKGTNKKESIRNVVGVMEKERK
jgi:DnaJ-class molecular chaperone